MFFYKIKFDTIQKISNLFFMISNISIQNLGLIENSSLCLKKGFTVITGETGAGKSFFCKALEIGMGSRIQKMPTEKTIVEVECFHHIFRRVIDQGKSRFFIDDIPETLEKSEEILKDKFYFHRQHDTQFLNEHGSAAKIIDEAMPKKEDAILFKKAFDEWKKEKKIEETLQKELEKMEEQEAFWVFSLEQMKDITYTKEEIEYAESLIHDYEAQIDRKKYIEIALQSLSTSPDSAITQIQKAEEALQKINHEGAKTLSSFVFPIAEIIRTLEKENPSQGEEIENAKIFLEKIRKWTKQYGVISPLHLLEKKQTLEEHIVQIEEKRIEKINQSEKTKKYYEKALQAATKLSESRKEFIPYFENTITKTCQELGMPPAQFVVECKDCELCSSGKEHVTFLFSANKNQALSPLSTVASGGEKSRIMLALYQFTQEDSVLIFDEIDTGVSGAIAEKMAIMMQNLSKNRQVIAITHLPQIAAKANYHIIVEKNHSENKSTTILKNISGEERILAIASMLSGERITEEAKETAKKLLEH